MTGTRLGGIGLASSLLVLLGACAQPEPTRMQPSLSQSPRETATDGLDTTILLATPPAPTPPVNGSADVVVAVDDVRISYAVPGCPVTAWLDEAIEDNIDFGIYPEYLASDDGTRWSTHLVVLRIVGASVTDWSFRLISPLSGFPGDVERSLTSLPDPEISMDFAITPSEATFTMAFWDSESSDEMAPQPVPGTVSVSCR